MKHCLTIYLLLTVLSMVSSCHMTIPEDNFNIRNRMISGDSLHIYSTLDEPVGRYFNESKTYYSVRFGKIRTLQGGIDGEPLQGVYELYVKKKLMMKGSFRNGLKNGKWFVWSANGTLNSITNYQAGVPQGEYKEFDQEGNLRLEGKFSKGQLNGLTKIVEDGQSKTLRYKDGVVTDTLQSNSGLFKWMKAKKSTDEE